MTRQRFNSHNLQICSPPPVGHEVIAGRHIGGSRTVVWAGVYRSLGSAVGADVMALLIAQLILQFQALVSPYGRHGDRQVVRRGTEVIGQRFEFGYRPGRHEHVGLLALAPQGHRPPAGAPGPDVVNHSVPALVGLGASAQGL